MYLENIILYWSLQYINTNMDSLSCSIGDQLYKPREKFQKTSWKPPPIIRLKSNTDASQIIAKRMTTISSLCRDDKGRGVHNIGEVSVLVAEVIVVCEALKVTTHLKMDNLFMESHSSIVINSVVGKITAPS